MEWIEMMLVFIMFSAKAFDHNWKNLSHEHWTRKLWIKDLGVSNWFHVSSVLVTWPVALYFVYPTLVSHVWYWLAMAAVLQWVWWYAKKMSGRENRDPWFVQIYKKLKKIKLVEGLLKNGE